MRKIEPQIGWRDDRAGLFDVRSQHFAKCGVHKVRRRVIAPCRIALFGIDGGGHFVADRHRSAVDRDLMDDEALNGRVCVRDRDRGVRGRQTPAVADLSARFCIKRRAVKYDAALCALADLA